MTLKKGKCSFCNKFMIVSDLRTEENKPYCSRKKCKEARGF